MPGALRIIDIDTALHKMVEGSNNVFVNGQKFCRLGDPDEKGDTINNVVSPNVFVNNIAAAFIGSKDTRDNTKITGSGNVFVNGG